MMLREARRVFMARMTEATKGSPTAIETLTKLVNKDKIEKRRQRKVDAITRDTTYNGW